MQPCSTAVRTEELDGDGREANGFRGGVLAARGTEGESEQRETGSSKECRSAIGRMDEEAGIACMCHSSSVCESCARMCERVRVCKCASM